MMACVYICLYACAPSAEYDKLEDKDTLFASIAAGQTIKTRDICIRGLHSCHIRVVTHIPYPCAFMYSDIELSHNNNDNDTYIFITYIYNIDIIYH